MWDAAKAEKIREEYGWDVESINADRLVLVGGGDFYNYDCDDSMDTEPDHEAWERAREIATKLDRTITDAHGEWWGYSEYTPDPGNVSIFYWE